MRIIKRKKIEDDSVEVGIFNKIIASFFFTGYFPTASGTLGSLAGLLFFLIPGFSNKPVIISAMVLIFVAGIITSKSMMKRYGDDPSVIVIDEVLGMWIAVFLFEAFSGIYCSVIQLLVLFFAFRIFDIIKIQPAKYFDKINSPFGIMMDDVVSGIYAAVIVYLIYTTGIINF